MFRDEAAKDVRLGQYFGRKPVILALVYYKCPMLCTMVLNDLTRSMNSLPTNAGEHFDVLAVSFDPNETPELAADKKLQYVRAYRRPHAEEGMHFLTGPQESISRLAAAVGFRYAWDAEFKQWAHASGLVILTPDGHIARYFYGIDYAPSDLRLALAEAGQKKISLSPTVRHALLFSLQPRHRQIWAGGHAFVADGGGYHTHCPGQFDLADDSPRSPAGPITSSLGVPH